MFESAVGLCVCVCVVSPCRESNGTEGRILWRTNCLNRKDVCVCLRMRSCDTQVIASVYVSVMRTRNRYYSTLLRLWIKISVVEV